MPMDEWEIHPDDLSPAQREVADLIGFENYLKLIDVYAAETIYIYAQSRARTAIPIS